ncbi:MAG: hypothetical protein MUO62_14820 [Anaerolineales bacterium]|nr:hypothetical protein [Anaerolineales bacterium]
MNTEKAALVITITLIVVILFNLAIYFFAKRRRDTPGEVDLLRKAAKRARNPWAEENANLESLSQLVAKLQQKPQSEDPPDD